MSAVIAFVGGLGFASIAIADRHGIPRQWVRRWVAYTWDRQGQWPWTKGGKR